jgi:large subunit ribosomal protein L22
MAPRKVRLVIDVIRGKDVHTATTQLSFLQKDAALPVLKLLKSAVANAEHNFHLDASALRVKAVMADGGPTLKRSRPRAHGSAAPIRKRTTHILLTLTDEPAPAPVKKTLPLSARRRAARRIAATAPVVAAAAPVTTESEPSNLS